MYKGVTIKRYNELAAAGYDEDFHKSPTGYESPPRNRSPHASAQKALMGGVFKIFHHIGKFLPRMNIHLTIDALDVRFHSVGRNAQLFGD